MATQLFLLDDFSQNSPTGSPGRGTQNVDLRGNNLLWATQGIKGTRGAGVVGQSGITVTGPTAGIEMGSNSAGTASPAEFVTAPLAAAVTISGTVTFNIWASESAMANNATLLVVAERLDSTGAIVSTITSSALGTELPTSIAAQNWTATPTSTNMLAGDRIRVRVAVDDATATTMAAANPGWTLNTTAASAGVSGDSYIQFNETITFLETNPTGTTLYLTDTASAVNPGAAIEKDAWTSRGSGSVNAVVNTVTGPTAPIQLTNTGGGTTIEWYSHPLTAFSLSGLVMFNARGKWSTATAADLRCEVAVTATDGSSPSVYGASGHGGDASTGGLSTTDSALILYAAGTSTAISDGQRLRFRIYIDDTQNPMVTGNTVTVSYSGTSAAAAGDTYVILTQSVTEFTPGADMPYRSSYPQLLAQ